jgi:type II secretion system protein G
MIKRNQKGFTLIELLIVVAIIGILAAIAIPNLLTAMARAKQKRTMADMRTIATAWEARATDTNRYNAAGTAAATNCTLPTTVYTASAMDVILSPTYMKILPAKDGWGQKFEYRADQAMGLTGVAAQTYAIVSYGKDGITQGGVTCGATTNFDCDIVYSQGTFMAYPEGVQQQ